MKSFIALRKIIARHVPTFGFVHLFWDVTLSKLVVKEADGDEIVIDPDKPGRVAGTPRYRTFATLGTLTMDASPADGDTFSAGVEVFRFMDIPALPNDIEIGVDIDATVANLIGTSMGAVSLAGTANPDEVNISASTEGTGGNLILITCSNDAVFGGPLNVLLSGGLDTTIATAGDQMFDNDYLYTALTSVTFDADSGWGKSAIDPL